MTIPNLKNMLATLQKKYDSIYLQVKELTSNSFTAGQNAGTLSALENDDDFNDILLSYENINMFKVNTLMVSENIRLNKYIAEQEFDPNTADTVSNIRKQVLEQVKREYGELFFTIKMVKKAIDSIDKVLNKYGVKSSFENRDVETTENLP